jgi:hypothetical protein
MHPAVLLWFYQAEVQNAENLLHSGCFIGVFRQEVQRYGQSKEQYRQRGAALWFSPGGISTGLFGLTARQP